MNARTPEWTLIERMKDANALSDLLTEAELRNLQEERANNRTRAARQAIKELGQSLTEQEACGLISALVSAIEASGWSHTDAATSAQESLLDAHIALESSI